MAGSLSQTWLTLSMFSHLGPGLFPLSLCWGHLQPILISRGGEHFHRSSLWANNQHQHPLTSMMEIQFLARAPSQTHCFFDVTYIYMTVQSPPLDLSGFFCMHVGHPIKKSWVALAAAVQAFDPFLRRQRQANLLSLRPV